VASLAISISAVFVTAFVFAALVPLLAIFIKETPLRGQNEPTPQDVPAGEPAAAPAQNPAPVPA